jgi:hypothetical protein
MGSMSAASNWSYTHKATHWPLIGRGDWDGALQWGSPVVFDCDYKAESKRMTDANGVEFTSAQILYTERDSINPGDRVMLGTQVSINPVTVGAWEVKSVTRFADTFDGVADDFVIAT